jgi:DNA-binding transcriptional LysR family regulator
MTLDPGDLDAFLMVVRQRSFGRAANVLLVSQPTVSERIARLERSVGAELFVRGPRGVSLTQAGDRLIPMAIRIVGLMEEAVEAVRSTDRPSPLRVGVHSTFAYRAVPLVVSALGSRIRGVSVRDAHSDEIIAMLLDGVLDAGFVLPGARPPALRFVALPPDPVVCVGAPGHELVKARSVPVRSVVQHDVALNLWGTGTGEFEAQLAPVAATGRRVECSDASTALQLARYHGYLAFVVHSAAQGEVAAGALKMLMVRGLPSWSVRLVLASRAKGEIDGDVDSLRRIVRQLGASRVLAPTSQGDGG